MLALSSYRQRREWRVDLVVRSQPASDGPTTTFDAVHLPMVSALSLLQGAPTHPSGFEGHGNTAADRVPLRT